VRRFNSLPSTNNVLSSSNNLIHRSVEPLFTSAAVINTFAEAPLNRNVFQSYWCNFIFNSNNGRFSGNISVSISNLK
jgi:hypothetical protein